MGLPGVVETPFDSLPGRERARRLRAAVRPALAAWGIEPVTVETAGFGANASYRVAGPDSTYYFLKVHDPSCCHAPEELDSISEWQNTLVGDPGFLVPRVIPTLSGELHAEILPPGVPGSRICTLEDWMPGRMAGDTAGTGFARKLGRVQALMHERSRSAPPGTGRGCRRFDTVFPYSRGSGAYREDVLLFDAGRIPELDPGTCRLFEEAATLVQAAIDSLFSSGQEPLMIHCDMHPSNVKLCGGRLVILDFEDSMSGYPQQDIAVSLYYSRFRGRRDGMFGAFAAGYDSVSPWPFDDAGLLETLIAGRALLLANFVLAMRDPEGIGLSHDYIPLIADRIRSYLDRLV